MNRDKWSSQNAARKFLITFSKQLEQNKILQGEIHEHFMIHKGYGTLCTTSSTFSLTLRPLWPIAWTTWLTQTRWPRSTEHTARRLWMCHLICSHCHIGSRASQCLSISSMSCALVFERSSFSCLSTSFSSSSSWFLPWCLMTTPWITPVPLRHREHGHLWLCHTRHR